jgi:hypothetical protein
VHTDILKAKIAIAKDPNWLKTHHVLNFNRNNFGKTINGKSPESIELRKVLKAIYIQLTERLPFTAPGDLIMGDICTDAAQIIENTSIEVSMAWWKLADEFGVPEVSLDPKTQMQLLREAGKKIPKFRELELIPIDDTSRRIRDENNYIHVNYFSFAKFSESNAWKLKDAELLKKVITELQTIKDVPKVQLTGIQQVSSNTNAVWIWILGGGIVLLLLLFILIRHKKSGQS